MHDHFLRVKQMPTNSFVTAEYLLSHLLGVRRAGLGRELESSTVVELKIKGELTI